MQFLTAGLPVQFVVKPKPVRDVPELVLDPTVRPVHPLRVIPEFLVSSFLLFLIKCEGCFIFPFVLSGCDNFATPASTSSSASGDSSLRSEDGRSPTVVSTPKSAAGVSTLGSKGRSRPVASASSNVTEGDVTPGSETGKRSSASTSSAKETPESDSGSFLAPSASSASKSRTRPTSSKLSKKPSKGKKLKKKDPPITSAEVNGKFSPRLFPVLEFFSPLLLFLKI